MYPSLLLVKACQSPGPTLHSSGPPPHHLFSGAEVPAGCTAALRPSQVSTGSTAQPSKLRNSPPRAGHTDVGEQMHRGGRERFPTAAHFVFSVHLSPQRL